MTIILLINLKVAFAKPMVLLRSLTNKFEKKEWKKSRRCKFDMIDKISYNLMNSNLYRAVVVERSRVSYLTDVLGMLKVEGSKHGVSVYIEKYFHLRKPCLYLDFW